VRKRRANSNQKEEMHEVFGPKEAPKSEIFVFDRFFRALAFPS